MAERTERGFSLLELVVVLAIGMIISAMAVPALLNTVRRYQLETSARNVQSVLLRARYEAVRQNNKICTTYADSTMGPSQGGPPLPHPPVFGLDLNCNGSLDPGEPVSPMSTLVQVVSTGEPDTVTMGANYAPGSTPPLRGMTLIGNNCSIPLPASPSPTFGAVGSVVQNPGNPCPGTGGSWIETNTIYVMFLQHTVTQQWAAVTLTPTGRVRVWYWNGSSWSS